MIDAAPLAPAAARGGRLAAALIGVLAAAAALRGTYAGDSAGLTPAAAAAVATLVWALLFAPKRAAFLAAAVAALAVATFSASLTPDLELWQPPVAWGDLLDLTPQGATIATLAYLAITLSMLVRNGRAPSAVACLALLATPYLFNWLLLLASPALPTELVATLLGRAAGVPEPLVSSAGCALILFAFGEAVVLGTGLLLDRRWIRGWPLHGLILVSAALAATTPRIAELGCVEVLSRWPRVVAMAPTVTAGALAQAGLWAQVFFLTGVILDGIRGRRPTWRAGASHWRSGLVRGAVYGGLFVALVQVAAMLWTSPALVSRLRAWPGVGGAVLGVLLFPLAKTLVESFDGSAPFHVRLLGAVREPVNYLRGLLAGALLGVAFAHFLPARGAGERFLIGLAIGAVAYAGADLLWDLRALAQGSRHRLQSWRVYALGTALGGFVGGALAWYVDGTQLAVISQKLVTYASVSFPAAGIAPTQYVIYPLFSKWGALDLGTVAGGVKLLYAESLSGVVNWSLAAPLFSINFVVLTAIARRSIDPLRELLSARGVAGLVEQAVRVLRWGLWMAPVIYSFLRLAATPTWYNQDGAVRSVLATAQSLSLAPDVFRSWSLELFLGLLAYDWLRVLIWFDHMGLRVATLVNLSFVGGDVLDEKAARFLGYSARTRCIPEGIRRFLTWAPLLIPFYIPRGAEWDFVWGRAEQLQATPQALLPAVVSAVLAYQLAGIGFGAVVVGMLLVYRRRRPAASGGRRVYHVLSNGQYTVEYGWDGRGFSHTTSTVRPGFELDLTRRPDDALQLRGKFMYLRELDRYGHPVGDPWSLGSEPLHVRGPDYTVTLSSPSRLEVRNSHDGLRAQASLAVDAADPVERWRIRLTNLEERERIVELTTYQEPAVGPVDTYRRSPSFAAMHVGTTFVRSLGAILARNRLMRTNARQPAAQRMCHEVGFHAVRADAGDGVELVGYEDSRARFIGLGTLRKPAALAGEPLRDPADEGLLYSFDPAASLRLRIRLAPRASVDIPFVDGYAEDERCAAMLIAAHLELAPVDPAALGRALARSRKLAIPGARATGDVGDGFSADGTEVSAAADARRPWTHVVANSAEHGAVLGADGGIFSFAGNAQQNALSPFYLESFPAQLCGQAMYVFDLAERTVHTATFVPCRQAGAERRVTFGLGYARYGSRCADLELDLTVFVPPEQPLELKLLRIRNCSPTARSLRVAPYVQLVLAEDEVDSRGRIRTCPSDDARTLLFSNPANDFHRGTVFVATNLTGVTTETVRARIVGGEGRDLAHPYMVEHGRADLSQADDGNRAACFCAEVEVAAGGTTDVVMVLGLAPTPAQAEELAHAYREPAAARSAFEDTRRWWRRTLGVLEVETDNAAFDRLVNCWLPYQVLCARLWGRTGPNQRSGAFGFRDQLQDVLPLVVLEPAWARKQILLHAAHQFIEGDAVKWWHRSWEGKTGLAVRTRASDPHLWLPYVVSRYVEATGDASVLGERVPFLEGKPLPHGQEGILFAQRAARDDGTVYEHCRRAVEYTLARLGVHGLPLLGSGDWNDGIDVLGIHGRGESVWLGFFFYDVLMRFAVLAERNEGAQAQARYRAAAEKLSGALAAMQRGSAYLRATTDDGEELELCSALMTAWPLLSGAVDFERGLEVLEAGLARLEKSNRVLLLTPPFDEDSRPYPGRIAEYPPGVRENGGQYSHGASWLVDAFVRAAEMAGAAGDGELAARCWRRALGLWMKISPLTKDVPGERERYGLPPHQQPADVYDGAAHAGRGGWSWYTGAAARMLTAAYALLGLRMCDGRLVHVGRPTSGDLGLRLKRVRYRGEQVYVDGSHGASSDEQQTGFL